MLAGIREILLISTPEDTPRFEALLGDGASWGIELHYAVQPRPEGIAQAFLVGEDFIAGSDVALILGDNILYGRMGLDELVRDFDGGALIFGYRVHDPERYGVVELTRGLEPSARGELEITDLNRAYLERGRLRAQLLGRGIAWLDTGTHESLLEAANFIATVERRQGLKIACPEEIALRRGFIDRAHLQRLVDAMPASTYRSYLESVLGEPE
jgi:glucose-1-phosphate thymidylyltransferase